MGDNFSEVIVKKKIDMLATFFRIFAIIVTVVMCYATLLWAPSLLMFVVLIFGFLCYVVFRNTSVEYEYTFVNGEFDVECIYGKSKRKKAMSFDFNKLEVLAPADNQRVLGYEHRRDIKTFNYSSGYEDSQLYVAVVYGKNGSLGRIIFEPSEDMVNAIKRHCPSKVY